MSRRLPIDGDGSVPEPTRYDLLLFVLPLPLLAGLVAGAVGPLPPTLGAAAGGLPSVALVAYALFGAAPTPPGDDGRGPAA